MAQIFISHSAKDTRIIEFINLAFASTKVEAKYEEIEADPCWQPFTPGRF